MVSGFAAQCCGPAFFVYGKAAEGDVGGGRWTGRSSMCESCGQSNVEGTACESCAGKGKTDVFLFLEEKSEEYLLCPPGGSSSRSAAIAALGYRHRRENGACAVVARRGKTQLVEGCGRRTQLIQLIYLRYLCGSAEREERMDVCFLLTLYI